MKPAQSFMSRIMSTLENIWGNKTSAAEPLTVSKPVPDVNNAPAMAAETQQHFNPGEVMGTSASMPSPTPYPRITAEEILAGLAARGNQNVPIAQAAPQLAELGNSLPGNIDPFFAAALALRESGGGLTSGVEENNPYGIMTWDPNGNRTLASYPDLATATLGGGPNDQMGLRGTLNGGLYNDFLQSGNLSDFFNTYSPAGENASTDEQIALFRELLNYFRLQGGGV